MHIGCVILIVSIAMQSFVMSYLSKRQLSVVGTSRIANLFSTASSFSAERKTFLLEYKYVDNMAEKRTPFREKHISIANSFIAEKLIKAGGAFTPELDGAMFIFTSTRAEVEDFIKKDPYVLNGLVPEYRIKEWNVVVGSV